MPCRKPESTAKQTRIGMHYQLAYKKLIGRVPCKIRQLHPSIPSANNHHTIPPSIPPPLPVFPTQHTSSQQYIFCLNSSLYSFIHDWMINFQSAICSEFSTHNIFLTALWDVFSQPSLIHNLQMCLILN